MIEVSWRCMQCHNPVALSFGQLVFVCEYLCVRAIQELFGAPEPSYCDLYCKTITFQIGYRNVIRNALNVLFG